MLVQFYTNAAVLNDVNSAADWMVIANNALYTVIDFISQVVLLYRCWIMWLQPLVMVIPCLLSLAFIVITVTTLGFTIRTVADNVPLPNWYLPSVTAFFFLSLAVNAVTTALIVYKILTVYSEIRGFHNSNIQAGAIDNLNGRRDLNPLVSILIESGLITFVGQLTQCLMFRLASDSAFPLISGVVVMLYGISMVVVLVRVEMGVSYDNNTLRTMNSVNLPTSEQPVQRTPFALKFTKDERLQVDSSNEALPGTSYARTDTAGGLPDLVIQNLNYSSVTSATT